MSLIEKITSKFQGEIELEFSEARQVFEEQKLEEVEDVESRSVELKSEAEEAISQLDSFLEELEGYEDRKERNLIEDVVDNIASNRRKLIENLSLSEDPAELERQLTDFMQEFQSMKKKEAAVMDEVNLMDEVKPLIGDLEAVKQEVENFLEGDYRVKKNYLELQQKLEEKKELEEKAQDLEKKLDELETSKVEQQVEEVEEKLVELRQGDKKEDYDSRQEELDRKEKKVEELESELSTSANRMKRGLKKLVYRAENSDSGLENTEVLKKLRDGEVLELLDKPGEVEKAVESAVKQLPDDLLDEGQRNKFEEGADKLEQLSEHAEKLEGLEKKIESLEDELDNHPFVERREELESEKQELETRLAEKRQEKDRLEQEKDDTKQEIQDLKQRVKRIVEESLDQKVVWK